MKIKKLIAMLMALVMVGLLVACNQTAEPTDAPAEGNQATDAPKPAEPDAPTEAPKYFNESGYPIVNEEITLRIVTKANARMTAAESMEELEGWKYLSKLIEAYTDEDIATKMPLIMSDPDNMPDLFWQAGLTEEDVLSYSQQGLLLQMDDLIDQYGPNVQACLAANDVNDGYARSVDGNIWSLPAYNDRGVYGIVTFQINNRWMENCGITEYPTNLEELKALLRTFKEMDANGNGDPNDEMIMMSAPEDVSAILNSAVGFYTPWPYTGAVYAADYGTTEAKPVYADERYRYVVEFMHELYAEGLFEENMFSVSADERTARRLSDLYGVLPGYAYPGVEEKYNADEWTSIDILASDNQAEYPAIHVGPAYQSCMAVISANTKYPEAVMRLLDYMFTNEGAALFSNYYKPSEYDLKAAGVSDEVIEMLDKGYAAEPDMGLVMINRIGTYGCRWLGNLEQYKLDVETTYASNIHKTSAELVAKYQDQGKIRIHPNHTLKFSAEEAETIAQYQTDIDTYVKDRLAIWIVGEEEELNDDTWAAYLAQLEKMNMDKLTDAYQSAYARFFGAG